MLATSAEKLGYTVRHAKTPDGLTLSYREYGSRLGGKTPVLCLAGLTRNAKDFHALALALAPERRVVTLDARGRGQSDYDPKYRNYNLVVEVGDALQVMTHAFERPCLIIGTSRGGLAAMIINQTRSALLAGVVLNDIGPELASEGLTRIVSYMSKGPDRFETWEEAVNALKRYNMLQFPDLTDAAWMEWARRSYRDEDGAPKSDYDPRLRDAVLEAAADGPVDFWPQFRALRDKPTLLLRGEFSDLLSIETMAQMRRVKPDLTAVTIRGRGHAPFLDEPEALQAIRQFLSHIDSGQ